VELDPRIYRLSPMNPSGFGLYLYLLAMPRSKIPGVIRADKRFFAKVLGWSVEELEGVFSELEESGLVETDWEHGLLFVPELVVRDRPTSINCVLMVRKELKRMPQCAITERVVKAIEDELSERSEKFLAVFRQKASPDRTESEAPVETQPEPKTTKKRGKPRKAVSVPPLFEEEGQSEEARKENQEEIAPPLGLRELVRHGVPKQIAHDWLRIRKDKKLTTLTQTAFEQVLKEADAAGMTLAEAITTSVINGWAGFRASWLSRPGVKLPERKVERIQNVEDNVIPI